MKEKLNMQKKKNNNLSQKILHGKENMRLIEVLVPAISLSAWHKPYLSGEKYLNQKSISIRLPVGKPLGILLINY